MTQITLKFFLGMESISTIARIAATGLASTVISHVAEELLQQSVPSLSLNPQQVEALQQLGVFKPEYLPAMVVSDMAITDCTTWDSSKKLLELATKKLNNETYLQVHEGQATFVELFANLMELGTVICESGLDENLSLAQILTRGTFSLKASTCSQQLKVITNVQKLYRTSADLLSMAESKHATWLAHGLQVGTPDITQTKAKSNRLFRRFRGKQQEADTSQEKNTDMSAQEDSVKAMMAELEQATIVLGTAESQTTKVSLLLLRRLWSNLHLVASLKHETYTLEIGHNIIQHLKEGPTLSLGKLLIQESLSPKM